MKERRYTVLQHAMKAEDCHVVAAFEPENVFYLTGFWGEAIAVCIDSDRTKLIAPKLEYSRAEKTSIDCEVFGTERGGELISTFVSQVKGRRVCSDCSDYSTVGSIRKQGVDILVNTDPFFQTRRIKDQTEIKVISKAAKILDRLYEICEEEIKVGLSERDLQANLIYEAMKMGANPPSYKSTLNPLIIAAGPNSALRHAGYIADATRTFVLGSATKEMKEVYDIVQDAQKIGLNTANARITCGQVDAACRNLITDHGYEKQFIHSTGHGIGLDVHEPPWLKMKNDEELRANMVVTVEPGIYIENKFGVRIEDSIIVNNHQATVLNKFTKDLLVLS